MATKSDTAVVSCPGCGAHFAISLAMVGRRARCAACETPFIVSPPPTSKRAAVQPQPTSPKVKIEQPQYIGFECRVCGTRMYARPEQSGKKVKCADCGAITRIPPPPKPKPKNMPAALEGEQYELWDADTQTLPREMAAAQPKYIPIKCRKCGTLMHGTEKQVGHPIACPDCGTTHIVPPPPKPVIKRSVLAPDAMTPKLDPAADPGERPLVLPSPQPMYYEEERETEYARAFAKSQRTGRRMEIDSRGRPVLPQFPLLSNVLLFPFSSGVPGRWFALTLGLVCSAGLIVGGVAVWVVWTPKAMDFAGGMQAFAGLAETFIGGALFIIWVAAASNIFIAIVSQSAVGRNRIDEWPAMHFISSMAEMLPVSIAIVFTSAPGWMLGKLLGVELWQVGLLAAGTLLLGFPITFLSQLSGNSTWDLVDLNVVWAAVRCPFSMMLFYLESACLGAMCIAATVRLAQIDVHLPIALAPMYVGCIILYARLLGRLGWRLSEKMWLDKAEVEDEGPSPYRNTSMPR